jgi:hypothetical protein
MERYRYIGGEISKQEQFINRTVKDFVTFTARYYGKPLLTALSEQEEEFTMDKEKDRSALSNEKKETEHLSASGMSRKEFSSEHRTEKVSANLALSNYPNIVLPIEHYRGLQPPREKPVSLTKEGEGTQFDFSKKIIAFPSKEEKEVIESPGEPAAEEEFLDFRRQTLDEAQPKVFEEKTIRLANITAPSDERGNSHSPRWDRPFGAYSNAELRALKFTSVEEFERAIKLCWHDPDLIGVPRGSPDGISLIVPEEAIKYFGGKLRLEGQEGVSFKVSKVLSPTDLPREKLAEMRRKYGM